MSLKLSQFGERVCRNTGILSLMEDLGHALSGQEKVYMLGGGNPALIPSVSTIWEEILRELSRDSDTLAKVLGHYDPPQGRPSFLKALAEYFNRHYNWAITAENIAITNGSQSGYFMLFNMLGGKASDGRERRILFPICPDYIGYADQVLDPQTFVSAQPQINLISPHEFKYSVNFSNLPLQNVAAIVCSRPTNPSGNVLTKQELEHLAQIAMEQDCYLIVDNAYGWPFPGIMFTNDAPIFTPQIVHSFSLSKFGLPGCRTGIFVGPPEIIRALAAGNAVTSLANGNLGPEIATRLIEQDLVDSLVREEVTPFYQRRAHQAREWLTKFLRDDIPWRLHQAQGSLFLWLWLENLPLTTKELYSRLKTKNVFVVPGEYFFFGLNNSSWKHSTECLRLNYSQPESVVEEGLKILAEEVNSLYPKV